MGINHDADAEVAALIARLRNRRTEPADELKEFYRVPDSDWTRRQQPTSELDELAKEIKQ
jgi:hypothetical protein